MNLLQGEINLTIDIIFGFLISEIIFKLGLADWVLKKFSRLKINPVTALAVAVSAGSSKTGAALISSAFEKNKISEREAIWSILMLPFPAYLKRWPRTFILSVSMAGFAGFFFALSLLFRSAARFILAYKKLKVRDNALKIEENQKIPHSSFLISHFLKTLPCAWIFFALAYKLVPMLNKIFENNLKFFSLLPLAGWTVAAASTAHVSTALALAGGSLAAGELNAAQAVFSLILGSGFGTATRILRQDAGYYFGFFPAKTARKMLIMNFFTIMPLIILNLIFASSAFLF